jgi:hypothetical protein
MSPECQNCGSFVTERYVRVFSRRWEDTVDHCPHCTNIKDGTETRQARSRAHADQQGEVASKERGQA